MDACAATTFFLVGVLFPFLAPGGDFRPAGCEAAGAAFSAVGLNFPEIEPGVGAGAFLLILGLLGTAGGLSGGSVLGGGGGGGEESICDFVGLVRAP